MQAKEGRAQNEGRAAGKGRAHRGRMSCARHHHGSRAIRIFLEIPRHSNKVPCIILATGAERDVITCARYVDGVQGCEATTMVVEEKI